MLNVDAARTLMADSLAFHIIFALLGVGLPLVILLIEQQTIRKKDPIILEHARQISYVTLVLVVAGASLWNNYCHTDVDDVVWTY